MPKAHTKFPHIKLAGNRFIEVGLNCVKKP